MATNRLLENRYQLNGVVGHGNYGQVFEAVDTQKNQKVAIKVLFPEVMTNPDLMKIVQMEIQILTSINHRYIIKILDYFSSGGQYFMVYEFCEKGDLKMAVDQKGKFSEIEALKIVYQIAEALCELKKHRIIHRDIKPENIFLTQDVCKLGDFGLCYVGDRVQLNASVGSLGFLAPETQGMLVYSSKADVYSLGICFYEMIHGDIPFTQDQIANLLAIKMNLRIERQSHINISDLGLSLMRRMTDPNEQSRIDCMEIRDMLAPMFPSYQPAGHEAEQRSLTRATNTRMSSDKEVAAPPPRGLAQSKNTYSCVNILSNEMMPASSVNIPSLVQKPHFQASYQPRAPSPKKFTNHDTSFSNQGQSYQDIPQSRPSVQGFSPSKRINQDLLPKLQKAIEAARNNQKNTVIVPQSQPYQSNEINRTYSQAILEQIPATQAPSYQLQPIQSWPTVYHGQSQPQLLVPRQSNESSSMLANQASGGNESWVERVSLGGLDRTFSVPSPQLQPQPSATSYGPYIQISSTQQTLAPSPSVPTIASQDFDYKPRQSTQPVFQPSYTPQTGADHSRAHSVAGQAFNYQGANSALKNNISSIIDAYRIDNRRPSVRLEIAQPQYQAAQYPARQQPLIRSLPLLSSKVHLSHQTRPRGCS